MCVSSERKKFHKHRTMLQHNESQFLLCCQEKKILMAVRTVFSHVFSLINTAILNICSIDMIR